MKIGIIGGSRGIGKFFLDFFKSKKIEVYFSSKNKPNHNSKLWTNSNTDLIKKCDILILAVPIDSMKKTFNNLYNHLENKTLIEVCSVKKFIIDAFKQKEKKKKVNFEFISLHPMFGETTNNLSNKIFIEVYQNKKSKNYDKLKKILRIEKSRFLKLNYLNHDKIMAYIQIYFHLNIFISASIIQNSGFKIKMLKDFSSSNYKIFFLILNRYINQNPKLYFEIQTYNSYGKEIFKKFENELKNFKNIIKEKNEKKFIQKFTKNKKYFQKEYTKKDYELSEKLINLL